MIYHGLKLRSINADLFPEAKKLIENGTFDFIELYIVPQKTQLIDLETLQGLPLTFHAPHGAHGFNPIDPKNDSEQIWSTITQYIEYLLPRQIIIHPEVGMDPEILEQRIDNFQKTTKAQLLIENMPMKSIIHDAIFYGHSLGQLKTIKKFHNTFCFDFAKAKSSALSQGLEPQDYISELITQLEPTYFHISGFTDNKEADEHWDLWEGDKNMMKFMKETLTNISQRKNIRIVYECRKKNGLQNDIRNKESFIEL